MAATWKHCECDAFGAPTRISANGNRFAAAGHKNDSNGADAGHARVFEYDSTSNTWIQIGNAIKGAAANDKAGLHTALSISDDGSIVAFGASFNDANGLVDSGHVRIFELSDTNWVQRGQELTGQAAGDEFGMLSLSSDGNTVAIGARFHDSNGLSNAGRVVIYRFNGSSWLQLGRNLDGHSSGIEFSRVAISGDGESVLIGAPLDDTNGVDSGSAQVYSYLPVENC